MRYTKIYLSTVTWYNGMRKKWADGALPNQTHLPTVGQA